MRIFRMAFVSGFVGALMAGNVATLHAAPLPTNVASMKSRHPLSEDILSLREVAGRMIGS